MAFTSAQIAACVQHLRYPMMEWSLTTVTNSLSRISNLSADFETNIGAILTELTQVQSDISTYISADAGTQVKTDGTVFFPTLSVSELQGRYRYLQKELSQLTQLNLFQSGDRILKG